MDKVNACIAIANIGVLALHLGNARTAMRIGVSHASPLRWAALAGLMALYFGTTAFI